MPQAPTLVVATLNLVLLGAVALAPAPWHLLAAAGCVVVPAVWASRYRPRLRSASRNPVRQVHLEVRVGRVAISRFPGPGTKAAALTPATPFPVATLESVLGGGTEWAAPIRRWHLTALTESAADHPAAAAYRRLLGPLDIPGRRRFLLTLEVDPLLLPPAGSVAAATARLTAAVSTHLTHHRLWSRLVDDRLAETFHDHGLPCASGTPGRDPDPASRATTREEHGTPEVVPGLGAGPVLGADSEDRAVCLDLAGPHLRHVVWVGPPDALIPPLLRCAALGWRAAVVTDSPQRWRGLAGAARWPLHLAAELEPALLERWSSSSGGTGDGDEVDAVLWDCEAPPTALLRRPPGIGPTLWQVLPQQAQRREAELRSAVAAHPDLVVDARVAGWITVETARRADGEEGPRLTVQAVEIPAEAELVAAAADRPQDTDVLAV